VAVSFIGGGNWRTRRKPLTNTSPLSRFKLTTSVMIGTDYITIRDKLKLKDATNVPNFYS
jgi:hypothetical protein